MWGKTFSGILSAFDHNFVNNVKVSNNNPKIPLLPLETNILKYKFIQHVNFYIYLESFK